jgi:hypothetical protein
VCASSPQCKSVDHKARRAHRLEHEPPARALKLRRPAIAIDHPRTAGRCRVDGEVKEVVHLLHVGPGERVVAQI